MAGDKVTVTSEYARVTILAFPFCLCSVNFLKLKVYYGELNFEVIDEERAYPVRNHSFVKA